MTKEKSIFGRQAVSPNELPLPEVAHPHSSSVIVVASGMFWLGQVPVTPTELNSASSELRFVTALPSYLWVFDKGILFREDMAVVVIYTTQSIHDTTVIAVEVRIPQSYSVLFLW